jgi:hypothetical protein
MMFANPLLSDLLTEPSPADTCPDVELLPPDRPRRDGPIGPTVAWLRWPITSITQMVGLLYVDTRLREAKVRLWHVVPGRVEIDYAETWVPLAWLSFERPR